MLLFLKENKYVIFLVHMLVSNVIFTSVQKSLEISLTANTITNHNFTSNHNLSQVSEQLFTRLRENTILNILTCTLNVFI